MNYFILSSLIWYFAFFNIIWPYCENVLLTRSALKLDLRKYYKNMEIALVQPMNDLFLLIACEQLYFYGQIEKMQMRLKDQSQQVIKFLIGQ